MIQQGGSFTALSFLGSSDPDATCEDLFAVASTGTMFKITVSAGVPSVEQVDLAAACVTAGAVIDIGALPSHSPCYRIALISSDDSCVTLWSSETQLSERPLAGLGITKVRFCSSGSRQFMLALEVISTVVCCWLRWSVQAGSALSMWWTSTWVLVRRWQCQDVVDFDLVPDSAGAGLATVALRIAASDTTEVCALHLH